MSAIEIHYRSAQRRLDALEKDAVEEPWKAAYQDAEACHYLDLALDSAINLFRVLEEANRSWRTAVYRAIAPPSEPIAQLGKDLYRRWVDLADALLKPLADAEKRGFQLEQSSAFRRSRTIAQDALAKWMPPLPSASPAMHLWEITEEEADEMRALQQAPAGSPGKCRIEPFEIAEGTSRLR